MARGPKLTSRSASRSSKVATLAEPVRAPVKNDGAAVGTGGVDIQVVRLPHGAGLDLPTYQSAGAAGLDLVAAVDPFGPLHLAPGKRVLVPTGLVLGLPMGFEAQVRPRSGLALKHGVTVLNSPGTIDCDYRGEVKVVLVNLGDDPFVIQRGDRIAQLVIAPVVQGRLVRVDEIDATARGEGGFGSTGVKKPSQS